MKKILLIISLIASSCSVYESKETEFRQRPTLVLDYSYFDKNEVNTIDAEVYKLDLYVYDNQGQLFTTTSVSHEDLVSHKGVVPLYGVPEGTYEVVTIANNNKMVTNVEKRVVTLNDIQSSCDSIFHSTQSFEVERGRPYPPTHMVNLDKKHYTIDLTVTGADNLKNCVVVFDGIPSGFNFDGQTPLNEYVKVIPGLQIDDETQHHTSLFAIHEFGANNNVTMELLDGNYSISDVMSLSQYLKDAGIGINFLEDKDIVIPIRIDITPVNITIKINDWIVDQIQSNNVGN